MMLSRIFGVVERNINFSLAVSFRQIVFTWLGSKGCRAFTDGLTTHGRL